MSESTVALKTDVNSAPSPQYYDVDTAAYAYLHGEGNGIYVVVKDGSGNVIDSTNRLQVDADMQWAGSDVSATNRVPVAIRLSVTASTNNSTTTALAANAAYTGTSEDLSGYAGVAVNVIADQDSATDGLQMQWSSDGTNWDYTVSETIKASSARAFHFPAYARYFRVKYTNGATLQGAFRLQTLLLPAIGKTDEPLGLEPVPKLYASSAKEASAIAKDSAGVIYGFSGYNDASATRYIQVFDSATVPADATVPKIVIPVASQTSFSFDVGKHGVRFDSGITICTSTTDVTKTIDSATALFQVYYR